MPADRLLVETDAPYLAPDPYRGKPNEPAYVIAVGAALAAARAEDADAIAARHARQRRRGLRQVNRTELRALLDKHDVRPSKALGQHFLVDPNTARRIVRFAGLERGDRVVEVGPGVGALTLALSDAGARVLARRARPASAARARRRRRRRATSTVVAGDALTVDWPRLLAAGDRWAMVSNLPYNVATPVVVRALEEAPMVDRMLVMVQREVGERLAADGRDEAVRRGDGEGRVLRGREGGRHRAADRLRAPAERRQRARQARPARAAGGGRRSGAALRARPRRIRDAPQDACATRWRAVFGANAEDVLRAAGIDPMRRAETLTLDDWARVAAVPE